MRGFDIGLSAIRTHQRTLNVVGNNIANASTPGYHRQRVNLVTRIPQQDGTHLIGTGVEVGNIQRLYDAATEEAILRNQAQLGGIDAALEVAHVIENLFTPGENSIHANLSNFLNKLESVANAPEVQTVRREFLTAAENLLQQFESVNGDLEQQRLAVVNEVTETVDQMNRLISDVADMTKKIRFARASGQEPNDLLDRRDGLITQLSQWADVEVQMMDDGREVVLIGGSTVSVGDSTDKLVAETDDQGQLVVRLASQTRPLKLTSGRLGGLLAAANETIPATQERLNELATTVVRSIDQQYATGLTDSGAYRLIQGSRGVDDVNVPLINSGLEFSTVRGEVTITVTEADGRRSSQRVAIDPYTDSLTDVAARLSAISGVDAVIDAATGRLSVSALGDRRIDFSGQVDEVPDLTAYTGTAQPAFSGFYSGDSNDEWNVTFNGSGTVGVTDGLTATVRDSAGQIVASVNIGVGYQAGIPLEIGEGISLQFGSGDVAGTDAASVLVTADPDNTGILSALGLNSLFTGTNVGNFALRKDIAASPELLAISLTGQPGDASNMASLANLRDFRFATFGDRTFVEELADFTADTGFEVQQRSNQKVQLEAYGRRLEEDREATSGVSVDEEILKMMEVERAFQAATRFITSVDDTMEEIMRIIQ